MPRTLLLSVGTSIAAGCAALKAMHAQPLPWDADTQDLETQVRERLGGFDLHGSDRVKASAELNTLHRLPCTQDDRVVLLATDTADGRCCAEMLKQVIQKYFGCEQVEVRRISGLQVRDEEHLRNEGLIELSRTLIGYLADPQRRYDGGCVICPNGGYKGIVPFLTLFAMVYRYPAVYVFENSAALIRLPPLPITLDHDIIKRADAAIAWGREQGAFDIETFMQRIPQLDESERSLFESLLETVPADPGGTRLACISPLVEALLVDRGHLATPIRLSRLARAKLESLHGHDRDVVLDYLRKFGNTLWRRASSEEKYRSDLRFAPKGNLPWRFAYTEHQGTVQVFWFARHDDYERLIPQSDHQSTAFKAEDFSDWSEEGNDPQEASHPHALLGWDTLSKRVTELEAELAKLRAQGSGASRRGPAKGKPKSPPGYSHSYTKKKKN